MDLKHGWYILQDVHDTGEQLKLYEKDDFLVFQGPQMSEWEELPELKHLQLIFSEKPYYGRELRFYNEAPWWYKNEFSVSEKKDRYILKFSNVDYYCKVWLNGKYLGEHEGYSSPFSFDITDIVSDQGKNRLIVKVWSPWDTEVDHDNQEKRTFDVYRNMVKGTYEHSDTFVQRDVNPVGIYGTVTVEEYEEAWFAKQPEFRYTLTEDLKEADITFTAEIGTKTNASVQLHVEMVDCLTNERVFEKTESVAGTDKAEIKGHLNQVRLWSTWDLGAPNTYRVRIWLTSDGVLDQHQEITGLRKIEMIRNPEETRFVLNGKSFYMRGTAYFPDNYVSNMNKERYRRDLMNMKACGFNMIRVHVHVDLPVFYELCTEIGIGVMHDSEYNWAHPLTDEFAEKFIRIYLETVDQLKKYPALFCWICMNEPGLLDTADGVSRSHSRSMDVNPGPSLYAAVIHHDPTRPVIKGSFCDDDPFSGDSHNYIGSLCGEDGHYSDIYGTVEKLNTEYGFDAPPCLDNLKKVKPVYQRLKGIEEKIDEIGDYQYHLLKYYTEHYRMQKYAPNAGYVQFLFSDIGPTSYYGLYDWWGTPKKGLLAMMESNMPTGVFMKYRDKIDAFYAVNDTYEELGTCNAFWHITDSDGNTILKGEKEIYIGADSITEIISLNEKVGDKINVYLVLSKDGKVISQNHYEDIYNMPIHTPGHPARMSHEYGVRLYWS